MRRLVYLDSARDDLKEIFTFKGYVILFRDTGNTFEVVNIIEGHRDVETLFLSDH